MTARFLKLLIIHPDEPFRTHLRERLGIVNGRVFEAASAAEANEIAMRQDLDVAVVGPSGSKQEDVALLTMIKARRPLTEVILLSAMEEQSLNSSIQAMQLGAFDDLPLPLDIQALRTRIAEACQRKRERARPRQAGGKCAPQDCRVAGRSGTAGAGNGPEKSDAC